ncbi:MAG: NADPH-dependent FMN reductase [Thermoleophilia bacterium]
MRILGISGSLREDSHNTRLLEAARRELPDGVELRVFDGLGDVPPYNQDLDHDPRPEGVERMREAVRSADAVLVATPEYNSSIPGVLKNALDWMSRPLAESPLRNMPVAVIGASTGAFGAVWSQAEARKVLKAIGARVVEGEVGVGHVHERLGPDGELADDELRDRLRELLRELVAAAERRAARTAVA